MKKFKQLAGLQYRRQIKSGFRFIGLDYIGRDSYLDYIIGEDDPINFHSPIHKLAAQFTPAFNFDNVFLEKRDISSCAGSAVNAQVEFEVVFYLTNDNGIHNACSCIETFEEKYYPQNGITLWGILDKMMEKGVDSLLQPNNYPTYGMDFIPAGLVLTFHVINRHEGIKKTDEHRIYTIPHKQRNKIRKRFEDNHGMCPIWYY